MSDNDKRPITEPASCFVVGECVADFSGPVMDMPAARTNGEEHIPADVFQRDARSNYHWELRRLRATARRKGS